KHGFKNALVPVLTLAGVNLVVMVNAAVIIEVVFAWPGIGRLLYEGIFQRDFPLVQGVVVLAGVMIVFVNLVIDILYAYIHPGIRLTKKDPHVYNHRAAIHERCRTEAGMAMGPRIADPAAAHSRALRAGGDICPLCRALRSDRANLGGKDV